MISGKCFAPLHCPHKTNVLAPQETRFSQMIAGLLEEHSIQNDCRGSKKTCINFHEEKNQTQTDPRKVP